jgi:hypothetical protein
MSYSKAEQGTAYECIVGFLVALLIKENLPV